MNQILNHIIKFLMLIIFIIVSAVLSITIYFDDKIEKSVINTIQKNLTSQLILDDVNFTFFENFPSASVKISNLLILESKSDNHDTLLFAKRAYIELSLVNIFHKKYDLENIVITDGKINIKYDHLNMPNFLIFKTSQETKALNIKKIELLNTKLKINHEITKLDLDWELHKSKLLIDEKKCLFNHTGFSNKLTVENLDFLNSKKIDFIAQTKIIKDTITILNSNLNIENIYLSVSGDIFNGNNLNLTVKSEKENIENIIMQLPEHLKIITSPIIAQGEITFDSNIKGVLNKQNNPFFNMKYEITKSIFKLKSIPFKLHNLKMSGSVNNGESRNFNSTTIIAKSFNAETKNGYINGNFTLKNLNNYFLTSQFKSSWDFNVINQYFEDSPFIGLNGRLTNKTNYEGNIAFNKSFKLMFLNANHRSDIKIEDVNFKYNISPLNFSFKNAKFMIDKHKIIINSCLSTISETDFDFKGEIDNFIPYLLKSAPKIYVNGDLTSTYTNLSELITPSEANNNIMPDWIDANTNITINNLSYKNFVASNINGFLSYKNKKINGNNLTAKTLNGNIIGTFSFSEINNQLKLTSNLLFKKINIRNSFEVFNDFNQTFIKREHLKGEGSAEVYIESYWNPDFILDKEKLNIKSHLIIEQGELINFKPLEKLSSYISLDELKHVKFSTLENTINISNKMITIPTMEIKSSALSVMLSGTHAFNQEINYEITLLLSELLSESFRRENTSITEFGEEERDGKIYNTIYLKMEGNTESPKISLNKIRFMEDLSNSIKKEKQIINDIIKEELLNKKVSKEKDIEIEWDPKMY